MPISVQLLDLNKNNLSIEFQDNFTPNEKDKKLFSKLIHEFEQSVIDDDEYLYDFDFSAAEILCELPVDELKFNDSLEACYVEGFEHSVVLLKKDNLESFEYIMSIIYNIYNIYFHNQEGKSQTKQSFKELVSKNIEDKNLIVIVILYHEF